VSQLKQLAFLGISSLQLLDKKGFAIERKQNFPSDLIQMNLAPNHALLSINQSVFQLLNSLIYVIEVGFCIANRKAISISSFAY